MKIHFLRDLFSRGNQKEENCSGGERGKKEKLATDQTDLDLLFGPKECSKENYFRVNPSSFCMSHIAYVTQSKHSSLFGL